MATTAFGPQGPNFTTTRPPADPKASAGLDTFAKNCTQAGAKDGTNLTADFYNTIIANLRFLCRNAPIELDDADDTMVYRAVQKMVAGVTATTLTANLTLWVNPAIGNDANDGLANTSARALSTIQRAIDIAFSYLAGQFVVTIRCADGLYPSGFKTPIRPGPAIVIQGNLSVPANVQVSSVTGVTMQVNGPNVVTIQGVRVQSSTSNTINHGITVNSGAICYVNTIEFGNCGGSAFVAANGSLYPDGAIKITGNLNAIFQAGFTGNILVGSVTPATITILGAVTMTFATCAAGASGAVQCPSSQVSFNTSSGSVTGQRYFAAINGFINTNGSGSSFFPGTVAGSTASGGQYI